MNYKKKLKALNALFKESKSKLEKWVITDILNEEEPLNYLKYVLEHGCVSGMVSKLVYYNQTKQFYVDYMDEIDEILQDIEDEIGEPLKKTFPIYNWMAWFGYEETARKVAEKIGLDI
jgi:hypothetical protein